MDTAFEDIKVVDFTWAFTGPLITKYLADHGATVVHIESRRRLCVFRTTPPFKDGKSGIDRTGIFATVNANKYGMALDLGNPKGIEVAKKLIIWSDVVVESFAPGVMENFRLGYEDMIKIKPDIIMLRASNQGQTGPYKSHSGYGFHLMSLSGFPNLVGWPDESPLPLFNSYTDYIGPQFGTVALIAALDHRRKTGEGQLIDLSQFEASLHFLTPLLLDYFVNQRQLTRMGNSCPYAAPHGVYKCSGDDRWCAIAVFTDEEWESLLDVMGNPEWSNDRKYMTLFGRKENEKELDKMIEAWTLDFTPERLMLLLQEVGVSAGIVENAKDLYEDPQLRHREHFWLMDHKELGNFSHIGTSFSLSLTPAKPRMPSHCLGEHTRYICDDLLGMSEDEFENYLQAGVFV